ncbi:MAG: hypothetical protein LUH04_12035, partial [Clostridium sp.]|nr:hypothetical protein [Clostridium sp.]
MRSVALKIFGSSIFILLMLVAAANGMDILFSSSSGLNPDSSGGNSSSSTYPATNPHSATNGKHISNGSIESFWKRSVGTGGPPYTGTAHTWGWGSPNGTTELLSDQTEINLLNNGWVVSGAAGDSPGENYMKAGTGNSFTMKDNTSRIKAGAGLNMRGGTIDLTAGQLLGDLMSDMGATWTIEQGTSSGVNDNLTITGGALQVTGSGDNTFNIGKTTLFDAAISLGNSGAYTNKLNFQNASNYAGNITATGTHSNEVTFYRGSTTEGTATYTNTGTNTFTWQANDTTTDRANLDQTITISGSNTNSFAMNGGTMSKDITLTNTGAGGNAGNTGNNVLNFAGTTFTGLADLSSTVTTGSATNSITISGGNVQGRIGGTHTQSTAVIGSTTRHNVFNTYTTIDPVTNVTKYGTATGWLFGSGSSGGTTFNLGGSKIYRISGGASGTYDHTGFIDGAIVRVTGDHYSDAFGLGGTAQYRDHVNQIINMKHLAVAGTGEAKSSGKLEVGNYTGSEKSQLTAETVVVETGGKLVLNETDGQMGSSSYSSDPDRHLIDLVEIGSSGDTQNVIRENRARVTVNQTTIHGTGTDGTTVNVYGDGILHGFGEWDTLTPDHNPIRPNIIGNVTLKDSTLSTARYGGILQPYDAEMFGAVNFDYKNVIAHVTAKTPLSSTSGITTFEERGTLSTRLFAETDGNTAYLNDGTSESSHMSDMLWSDWADFSKIYDYNNPASELPQNRKAQYDPVFGFQYELVSKQAFKVYKGDGTSTVDTYYYTVARTDNAIAELAGRTDANHLFNRDIIKSDMLGEWWFDMGNNDNSGIMDQSIILRFRLLAEHPSQGG